MNLPRLSDADERGFGLLDNILAVLVFSVALTVGLHTLTIRTVSIALKERQRAVNESVENGLEALRRRNPDELPDTPGTFTVNADNTITVTGVCANLSCDKVPAPDETQSFAPSIAGGAAWSATLSSPMFVRRWRVETIDPTLGLRQITLVLLPSASDTQPLAVKTTQISIVR